MVCASMRLRSARSRASRSAFNAVSAAERRTVGGEPADRRGSDACRACPRCPFTKTTGTSPSWTKRRFCRLDVNCAEGRKVLAELSGPRVKPSRPSARRTPRSASPWSKMSVEAGDSEFSGIDNSRLIWCNSLPCALVDVSLRKPWLLSRASIPSRVAVRSFDMLPQARRRWLRTKSSNYPKASFQKAQTPTCVDCRETTALPTRLCRKGRMDRGLEPSRTSGRHGGRLMPK
jgi:hypothetical protein